MEFVAQKLGFLKCAQPKNDTAKMRVSEAGTFDGEDITTKKRKLSNEQSSSSDSPNSDLSFGKLRLSQSDEEMPQPRPPNRSYVSIPTPVRPGVTSRSLLNPSQFKYFSSLYNLSSTLDNNPHPFPFLDPQQQQSLDATSFLSYCYAPYGVPSSKLIGTLTPEERRVKVDKYLEKKKSRQWKNVKYTVRQELAENRKRVQGKFVKTDRKWKWNEVPVKKEEEQPETNNKDS